MFPSLNSRNLLLGLLSVSVFIIPQNSQITYLYKACFDPPRSRDHAKFESNLNFLLNSLSSKSSLHSFFKLFHVIFMVSTFAGEMFPFKPVKTVSKLQRKKSKSNVHTTIVLSSGMISACSDTLKRASLEWHKFRQEHSCGIRKIKLQSINPMSMHWLWFTNS